MSGNIVETGAKRVDRRVVATRDALGDALIVLMQERAFAEITVQDVLDRAGVGRSTFYKHYRDKDDLFLSDVEEFFGMISTWLTRTGADARRLAPVRELFGHVGDSKALCLAMQEAGKWADVVELAQGLFARAIAERLRLAGIAGGEAELAVRGCALAGSLFALLDWWMKEGKGTAEEMDGLFHRMAWGGVGGAG